MKSGGAGACGRTTSAPTSPTYLADNYFAEIRAPLLSVGFTDDPIATRRTVEELNRFYPNAARESRWYTPADAGSKRIGHEGFFASRHRDTLWRPVIDWIDGKLGRRRMSDPERARRARPRITSRPTTGSRSTRLRSSRCWRRARRTRGWSNISARSCTPSSRRWRAPPRANARRAPRRGAACTCCPASWARSSASSAAASGPTTFSGSIPSTSRSAG